MRVRFLLSAKRILPGVGATGVSFVFTIARCFRFSQLSQLIISLIIVLVPSFSIAIQSNIHSFHTNLFLA